MIESEFRDRDPRTLQGNTRRDKMLQDFSYISLASSSSGSRGSDPAHRDPVQERNPAGEA